MSDLPCCGAALQSAHRVSRAALTRRWSGRAVTAITLAALAGAGTGLAGLAPAHAEPYPNGTITVDGAPSAVAFSPDGTKALVTDAFNSRVSVIRVDSGSSHPGEGIQVSNASLDVAFSKGGTKAYVLNSPFKGWPRFVSRVSVIDVDRLRATNWISVGEGSSGLAVSPDGTQAYVTNTGSKSVSVIDIATDEVSQTIAVNFAPTGLAFSPDGTKVYFTDGSSLVRVMSVATHLITYTIAVGQGAAKVAFTPDGTKAYVTNSGSNSVSVIDVASDTVRGTVAVGTNPLGVAVSPDGTTAYVTNNYISNSVSVIDVASDQVSVTLAVGADPTGVAVSPNGASVYVANSGERSVSVIAPFVSMRLSPSSPSVQVGVQVKLTTTGYTSSVQIRSNDLGPVSPVYTTDSAGVVSAGKVTFSEAGPHTVTATLHGVVATVVLNVTPAPGPAPSRPPSPTPSASVSPSPAPTADPANGRVAIDGPATVAPRPNGPFVITGTAPAGATVTLNFHTLAMVPAEYSLRRTVTASPDGTWRRTIAATNDYRYYATALGEASAPVLFRPAPTVDGATSRVVPLKRTYVLTGTALPGSTVFVHFHKRGMPTDDYSLVRSARANAAGTWQLRYLADTDCELYVSRAAADSLAAAQHYVVLAG